METKITVRHTTIPDSLKEKTRELISKLLNRARRPHDAHVVFDLQHQRRVVEIKLHLDRGQVIVASAEADDFKTALDRVVDKAANQLQRIPSPVKR